MKAVAYLLIVAGFLGGAFLASTDPLDVRWLAFGLALVLGAGGVVILRYTEHHEARDESLLAAHRESIEQSLDRLTDGVRRMNEEKARIPVHELRGEIDRRFREDLMSFADARKSLAHLYGLQAYADIMSPFAAGERYINRVWSASADGYQDEAHRYLTRAEEQFIEARTKLEQAHRAAEAA